MNTKTLEVYLADALERGIVDHHLRASLDASGKVTFYIHPLGADGETLDYVVRNNELAPNLTSDSDVPVHLSNEAIDRAACLAHQATKVAEVLELLKNTAYAESLGGLMTTLINKSMAELGA